MIKKTTIHEPPSRILLMLFGGIGDVLMFTPAIEALGTAFPHAEIHALVRSGPCVRVLENNPLIHQILAFDRNASGKISNRLRLVYQIRKKRYDLTITSSVDFDFKTSLLSFFSGAKMRIGPDIRLHGIGYNRKIRFKPGEHFINRNLRLVGKAGAKTQGAHNDMRFFLNDSDQISARHFLDLHGIEASDFLVGIHPGGGPWRYARRWPERNYVGFIRGILGRKNVKVILFIGPDEVDLGQRIAEKVRSDRLITPGADTSLGLFAALARRCDVFLCNDGGPLHIAAAMGTPFICIVGPTDRRLCIPRQIQGVSVKKVMACSPCIDNYKYSSRGCAEKKCMHAVSYSEVLSLAEKRLDRFIS